MAKLQGKVALVTGASRGLGKGIALAFAREGAKLAIGYNKSGPGAEDAVASIKALGGEAQAFQGDITQADVVDDMVARVVRHFATIHILVNNAGLVQPAPMKEMTVAQWDDMFAIHVRAMFLMTRASLPHMSKQRYGKIINMSGTFGVTGMEKFVHMSAAKAAMIGFTRALAREVGPEGIYVNCIAPAMIESDTTEKLPKDYLESLRQRYPLRKLGSIDDVNACALFLASSDSDFVTGQTLAPAGGEIMP